ncbi:hypothetical protein D9M69_661880 [compost metagenome]
MVGVPAGIARSRYSPVVFGYLDVQELVAGPHNRFFRIGLFNVHMKHIKAYSGRGVVNVLD